MRIAQYITFLIFSLLCSFTSNAQNKLIDSLKRALQTQKEDTNRVNTLNQLSLALRNDGYYKEAKERIETTIQLSRKLNFKKGEGVAYGHKSSISFNEGDYPVALNNSQIAIKLFHDSGLKLQEAGELVWAGNICRQQYNTEKSYQFYAEALKIYQKIGNKQGVARTYADVGDLQRLQENFSEALRSFLAALKIQEEIGNKLGIAYVSGDIAYTYWDIGSYPEALKYHQAALALSTEIKNEFLAATCKKNMGDCYLKLSNYPEALNQCTTALKSLMKAGDQSWVSAAYTSIGTIYEAMGAGELQAGNKEQANKNFEEALKYYLLGLNINQKTKFNLDESHYNLGNIYTRLNRLEQARNSFEKSLEMSKQTNFKRVIKSIYLGLSKIDSLEGNYKLAYEHYQKYNLYRDSLGDENNSKAVVELKLMYDFDKKDAQAKAEQIKKDAEAKRTRNLQYTAIGVFLLIALFLFWNNRQKQRSKIKIEKAYSELKATQQQLIQSEKMASLGELTAGIAHEIQNPLNFVNNFSEVNKELIDEAKAEIDKGNTTDVHTILDNIRDNQLKINQHGKRADAIVKNMLQHSRINSGKKEPTDINALAEEYLGLSYHGFRAKDKSFNAITKTEFDDKIGKINIVPQEIGRVLLNLYNNAFYAASLPSKGGFSDFDRNKNPTVWLNTKKIDDKVLIIVKDNGPGIPQKVLDKIFQPFFTTKPTGQGTGLGLSLAYDIVKAHGGEIKLETGEGSSFIISLPAT